MKITKNTNINELILKEPKLAEEFFNFGMMCVGCPMSQGETIEQGCKVHGMSDEDVEKFVEKLNKKVGRKIK